MKANAPAKLQRIQIRVCGAATNKSIAILWQLQRSLDDNHDAASRAAMSILTYASDDIYYRDGGERQATCLVARRGEDAAFSGPARLEAGSLLRRLQGGERLAMPQSRPMPSIGTRCHELRVVDAGKTWRIVYRTDADAIVIADVFQKTTQQTPARVIADCARRLRLYDQVTEED